MIKWLSKIFAVKMADPIIPVKKEPVPVVVDLNISPLEEFIMKHEGLRLVAYLDPAGVPTIGWGHIRTVKKSDVGVLRITKAHALELLRSDLLPAKFAAHAILGVSSGDRFNGITSFVFNLGPGALHGKETQIGRHLMAGNFESASIGMQRYVYGGGKRLPGLVTRRKEEGKLVSK